MQRSPGLEEKHSSPGKCTQIGNKLSEHLMREEQEGQGMAAATGAAKTNPISGFLILSLSQSIQAAALVIQSQ